MCQGFVSNKLNLKYISQKIFLNKNNLIFSSVGLLRWRFNRVWNKQGGYSISQLFEYKDEVAYTKGQELLEKMMVDNQNFFMG